MPVSARKKKFVALFVCPLAIGAGACSNSSSSAPSAQVPTLGVVSIVPADRAEQVAVRSEVVVTFAQLVSGVTVDQFRVEDAAGPLQGELTASPDGRVWRWSPFRDLPRGGRVRVRLAADIAGENGDRLATELVTSFVVREADAVVAHWLGEAGLSGPTCLAWPDGRRAVVSDRRVHSLSESGQVSQLLPLLGDPVAVVADAVGGYAMLARQGSASFLLEVARGDIQGQVLASTVAASPGLFGRAELLASGRGDLAVYWYGVAPTQALEGLWHARPGSTSWTPVRLPDAGEYPLRRIAIDGLGNMFVATVDVLTARLSLQRTQLSTGVEETFEVCPSPDSFWLAALGNGDALVIWRESSEVAGVQHRVQKVRRYRRGIGFDAPVELRRGPTWVDDSFVCGESGAVAVVVREPEGLVDERLLLRRIAVDGTVGESEVLYAGPMLVARALAIAPRGEAWFVYVAPDAQGRDAVMLSRSRPGAVLDAPRELHHAPQAMLGIRELRVALDDAGRAVVAFHEDQPGMRTSLLALRID